jgi:hypothetical protein
MVRAGGLLPVSLTSPGLMFTIRSHAAETLGEAWRLGWRVTARCARGKREAMKSRRECTYKYELDLPTLVWTRGPNFPISRLESRLMCPRCGSRHVVLMFSAPGEPRTAFGG